MVGYVRHQRVHGAAFILVAEQRGVGRKSRPYCTSQKLAQQAKAFYEGIGAWLVGSVVWRLLVRAD